MISIPFTIFSIYSYLLESKRYKTAHTEIDRKFISENNKKILFAIEEFKNYILLHPELKKYFEEDKTTFLNSSFNQYRSLLLDSGYDHEERLDKKRWEIVTRVSNISNEYTGRIYAIVLFHSPSNFTIEYMRFDLEEPIAKKITIIDGRRDMKTWVDELDIQKIDKRVHPKYRNEDNIKY
jgi:hypothetical protein